MQKPMTALRAVLLMWMVAVAAKAGAETYYVSTTGSDGNSGSIDHPFASLQHANGVVAPGDTVYIRGGTYRMAEKQIDRFEGIFARVICLDKSGAPGRPINYFAYQDEHPVFDFSDVKPNNYRVYAISVPASWIHLKGLEVVGVQVTIKEHTQSICFENNGSHNIYEQLRMHDGMGIGYYSVQGAGNLVLNCDAYNNWDTVSENGKGGNTDGFGCHPKKGGTGNVFRGCRSWFNSDDGFDLINAAESVTIENCWAFFNGYSSSFERLADGNGFKGGGYGSTPVSRLPDPVPRHVIRNDLSVHNKANGFYANHHIGGNDWIGNTAINNGVNYNMLCRLPDNHTEVPGYGHVMRDNVGYACRTPVKNLDEEKCTLSGNVFDKGPAPAGFDESQLVQPRLADGHLPQLAFLEKARFESLSRADWTNVFADPCTKDWHEGWFLDGLKAKVDNSPAGMVLSAGPVQGDDSCHAVLWTRQRFEGDIRIDYEFTKLDETIHNVNILYVLASGSGEGEYSDDIEKWRALREVPSMRLYFNHMNTYHISYAAYSQDNNDPLNDYIRARRYMPETGKGLAGTALKPDYLHTGVFKTGVPYHITVIKHGDDLFMQVRGNGKEKLCHWKTDVFPPITEGRIGLRQMYTRIACYRDFRVAVLGRSE